MTSAQLDKLVRASPAAREQILKAAGLMGARAILAAHGPMATPDESRARREAAALCEKHCAATGIEFVALYKAAVKRVQAAMFEALMISN